MILCVSLCGLCVLCEKPDFEEFVSRPLALLSRLGAPTSGENAEDAERILSEMWPSGHPDLIR